MYHGALYTSIPMLMAGILPALVTWVMRKTIRYLCAKTVTQVLNQKRSHAKSSEEFKEKGTVEGPSAQPPVINPRADRSPSGFVK